MGHDMNETAGGQLYATSVVGASKNEQKVFLFKRLCMQGGGERGKESEPVKETNNETARKGARKKAESERSSAHASLRS